MNEQQLINRLKWALYNIEKHAYEQEKLGNLYSAGMRDSRKTIENAFFNELDNDGYYVMNRLPKGYCIEEIKQGKFYWENSFTNCLEFYDTLYMTYQEAVDSAFEHSQLDENEQH